MKKRIIALILALTILLASAPALAGVWKQNENGRWFENSDGSRPSGGMFFIGGSEYIFDEEGYMRRDAWVDLSDGRYYCLSDGTLAKDQWIDGEYVGADGKWAPQIEDAVPVLPDAQPVPARAAPQPTAAQTAPPLKKAPTQTLSVEPLVVEPIPQTTEAPTEAPTLAPAEEPTPAPTPVPTPAPTTVLESDEIQSLIRAADAGDTNAMLQLADKYRSGYITGSRDQEQTLNWTVKAANAGNPNAMLSAGQMFYYGHGTEVNYDLAAYYWYAAADKGVAEAMYNIGFMFHHGYGVEKNTGACLTWWKKGAELNEPKCLFALGLLYRSGAEVTRSAKQAREYLYRAICNGYDPEEILDILDYADFGSLDNAVQQANAGNVSAMCTAGYMFYLGDGTEENDELAAYYWYSAAEKGNALSMFCIACMFIYGMGVEENDDAGYAWIDRFIAADWNATSASGGQQASENRMQQAAQQNRQQQNQQPVQQQTQQNTGWNNANNQEWNEEDDWDDAESLISRLGIERLIEMAQAGDPQAAYTLGYAYTYGVGVDPDPDEAFGWYLAAAEEDYYLAFHVVADLLYQMQNYDEAIRWYKKAAEEGFAEDMNTLGNIYYHGKVVPQNYAEALKWYLMAAEEGDDAAMHSAADILAYGYGGVPVDDARAFALYMEAANLGNIHSMNNVGAMYFNGRGVTRNYGEAVNWFRKAAEAGNPQAMYNLGAMYEAGKGVSKSASTARSWYERAAAAGHEGARQKLGK